jgi:hypothetical protein
MLLRRSLCILPLILGASLISAPGCGKGEGEAKKGGDSPTDQIAKKKQPPDDSSDKKSPPDKKAPPEKKTAPKADYSLSAKDFMAEFEKDKQAARAKYEGKVLQLTGPVGQVGRGGDDTDFLVLNKEPYSTGAMCFTKEKEPWKTALPGQSVTIIGTADLSLVPALVNSVIVEKTGSAPVTLTADELAKEYAADPQTATKKYRKLAAIILKGEIARIEKNEFGSVTVIFRTEAKSPIVHAYFTNQFYRNYVADLKLGQKISVVGEITLTKGRVGTSNGGILER